MKSPMKCLKPRCKEKAMFKGLCCKHYLQELDEFEARSRRSKHIIRSLLSQYTREEIMDIYPPH